MKPWLVILTILSVACLTLVAQQPLQRGQPSFPETRELKIAAVNEVRALNTAEMGFRNIHGRFAGLEELKSSDDWQKMMERANKYAGAQKPDITGTYETSLITDQNGTAYRISVKPKTDRCQSSFFSDESGLIFEARVLDCPSLRSTGQ